MNQSRDGLSCPIPHALPSRITMQHGGGGRAMQKLIRDLFARHLDNGALQSGRDAATLPSTGGRIAFSTDSFVVRPVEFPGGNVGSLAVHGTVNDLAMAGATPRYLSAGFILEEGLALEVLDRVVRSMRDAADRAGVSVVTGDTKVIERTHGDGLIINTSGIGSIADQLELGPSCVRQGDAILLNGDLGRHGIAVMAARERLEFEPPVLSDSAPLAAVVADLLSAGIRIRCMRDCTRGGLAAALNEIAEEAGLTFEVDERAVPVSEQVRGACEILGLDPFHVACEGRFLAVVAEDDVDRALRILEAHTSTAVQPAAASPAAVQPEAASPTAVQPEAASPAAVQPAAATHPASIGRVLPRGDVPVQLRSAIGVTRVLEQPSGEQLPRIC